MILLGLLSVAWASLVAREQRWATLQGDALVLDAAARSWREDRRASHPPVRLDRLPALHVSSDSIEIGPYTGTDARESEVVHQFSRREDGWLWERSVTAADPVDAQRLAAQLDIQVRGRPGESRAFLPAEVLGPAGQGRWWCAHRSEMATAVVAAWCLEVDGPTEVSVLAESEGVILVEWPGASPPRAIVLEGYQRDPGREVVDLIVRRGNAEIVLVLDQSPHTGAAGD